MSANPSPGLQPRVIRVFVSSTFRDMQAEREELVKRVFPQLRKLCESRGVVWGEVDLRWGVTDEQKAEGKVLPICLAEIQRCRPYFIGLLGERYGWVPEEIPQELIEQEPWLKEHLSHSVTELEILHGVLNNRKMADHAFFYFRDTAYIESLPPDKRESYLSENPESAEKLQKLKERIRASKLPLQEKYANPQALGELVLADLKAVIDRLYPEGSQLDPLDRDSADHEAFAQSRAQVYIGRQENFDRLNEHAAGDSPPLVVLGESGSGKSALLSNWALQYRQQHSEEFVFMHFIGATPYSADWAAMLRRIMGEFKRRFGIRQDIPDKPDELRMAFANWLHMAAAWGRVVLILDALNQLEDRDGAPDLVWLPPVIPANVRLLLSTLPGRPLEDLTKRGWPTLTVEPLRPEERKYFISEYLAQYTKSLEADRAKRIVAAPQTANSLFLKALLEELRVFGIHERLDERINHYLSAQTIPELYEKILARFEEDYERDRPGLVGDAMSLLWAACRGLSEKELLELLGSKGEPLLQAIWSPLYLAAEQAFVNRSGLIGFFHNYLREAVRTKYLSDGEQQRSAHIRLASYFEGNPIGDRKADELAWQLAQAEEWERLRDALGDIMLLEHMHTRNGPIPLLEYWSRVAEKLGCNIVEVYALTWKSVLSEGHELFGLSTVLGNLGFADCAEEITEAMIQKMRTSPDKKSSLARALYGYAQFFIARNSHDRARRILEECLSLCLGMALDNLRLSCLNDLAGIEFQRSPGEAMHLLKEIEGVTRQQGDRGSLAACLGNQANVLMSQRRVEEALKLEQEAIEIFQTLSQDVAVAEHRVGAAACLHYLGRPEEAMRDLKKAEEVFRQIGIPGALGSCLGKQANILAKQRQFNDALRLALEAERCLRGSGQEVWLATCLFNLTRLCLVTGRVQLGLEKGREALSILERCGAPNQMIVICRQLLADLMHCNATASAGQENDAVRKMDQDEVTIALFNALEEFNGALALKLVESGANVKGRDMQGNTPLHHFFRCQDIRISERLAKALVEHGADVNAENDIGDTPWLKLQGIKNEHHKRVLSAVLVQLGAKEDQEGLARKRKRIAHLRNGLF